MLVSINWLKDYIDVPEMSEPMAKTFCDKMIMSGSNIETVEETGKGFTGVKLGRIEKIDKHPEADKLVICKINLGKIGMKQIVTGAPNVCEGAYVPVAMDGSHIPGPLHGQPKAEGGVDISAGEIRGIKSDGMICSPEELGLSDKVVPMDSKDGIWILPGDWEERLGEDFDKATELSDVVIDFEITPNRPDCLSMLGMAREAAATFGSKMNYPETECEKTGEKAEDYISVEVNSELCKRYTARVIKDVKIGQSPWWMQKRLMGAGMRPINNIVDITNFVMMEYGQPLHAFDIRGLEGNKIVVDIAEKGGKFITLDGTERELDDTMLMIKDGEKPVALAGVMGGLNSEILPDTETVVIESANFLGSSVRQTSKKLGLRTEASGRYEKGIDPNLCEAAADRVCKLVEILGCGKILEGSVDVYKVPEEAPTVTARVSRINKVLGTDLPRDVMVKIFKGLEMKVTGEGDNMVITPPSVRQDLLEEVDYVEEVARIYGYDNLPNTLPELTTKVENSKNWDLRKLTRDIMCGMGANEIQTFSFISDKDFDALRIDDDSWERDTVKVINPMGEDTSAVRTILMPGMLDVLGRNYSRGIENVRAYEIGIVFSKNLMNPDGLPDETRDLSIGAFGEGENFFTLKGMVETLMEELGIKNVKYVSENGYGLYHPGRCARIIMSPEEGDDIELGIMGEIHPDVAENYGLGERAYGAEIFFDKLVMYSDREVHYVKPPRFPSMSRDIAMIVDEDEPVANIEDVIKKASTELLRDVKLFDVYRGEQVGEGKKSVAFSLTYRRDDRTLTDEETEEMHGEIVKALKEELGALIRDN